MNLKQILELASDDMLSFVMLFRRFGQFLYVVEAWGVNDKNRATLLTKDSVNSMPYMPSGYCINRNGETLTRAECVKHVYSDTAITYVESYTDFLQPGCHYVFHKEQNVSALWRLDHVDDEIKLVDFIVLDDVDLPIKNMPFTYKEDGSVESIDEELYFNYVKITSLEKGDIITVADGAYSGYNTVDGVHFYIGHGYRKETVVVCSKEYDVYMEPTAASKRISTRLYNTSDITADGLEVSPGVFIMSNQDIKTLDALPPAVTISQRQLKRLTDNEAKIFHGLVTKMTS